MKWSCISTRRSRLRQLLVCVSLLATLSLLFLIVSLFFLPAQLFQTEHVIRNGLPYARPRFSNGDIYSRDGSSLMLTEPKPASQVTVRLGPRTRNSADAVWRPTTEALSSSTVTTHRYLTSWKTTGSTASSSWYNIYTPTKLHAVLKVNKSDSEEIVITTLRPLSTSVTRRKLRPTVPIKKAPICIIDNCEEFLSIADKFAVTRCRRDTLKHPGVIHVKKGTCRFLSDHSRQPVALVSSEGSGNMWLRGLLERSTGICTGFSYCDYEARARGFAGEGVNSGQVLVVKTHLAPTQWIGNERKVKWEGLYDSAVFLIRNPARSLIAEWNRRMSTKLKMDTYHFHPDFNDSHTNVVSEDFFLTKKWSNFSGQYLDDWIHRLNNWVLDNHGHPVHVVNYEDLKRDTVREVEKILDFLQFPYSHEEVVERLTVDYTDFQRPHTHDDFQHFSPQQKEKLRTTLLTVMGNAKASGKADLFLFNEYLDSLPDIK